jgi:hypothetical protein
MSSVVSVVGPRELHRACMQLWQGQGVMCKQLYRGMQLWHHGCAGSSSLLCMPGSESRRGLCFFARWHASCPLLRMMCWACEQDAALYVCFQPLVWPCSVAASAAKFLCLGHSSPTTPLSDRPPHPPHTHTCAVCARCLTPSLQAPDPRLAVIEGPVFRALVLRPDGCTDLDAFAAVWPHMRVMARCTPADKFTLVQV